MPSIKITSLLVTMAIVVVTSQSAQANPLLDPNSQEFQVAMGADASNLANDPVEAQLVGNNSTLFFLEFQNLNFLNFFLFRSIFGVDSRK